MQTEVSIGSRNNIYKKNPLRISLAYLVNQRFFVRVFGLYIAKDCGTDSSKETFRIHH